jgi:SAM-dependent methyltransferase
VTSGSERIVGLYQRHAAAFDRERFLGLLPSDASILDLGCGSAEPIARYLRDQRCRITGIDSAPALIELARSRFPDQEWMIADMRTLELGRRFEGILAWDSFFHLNYEDQRAMFSVFARHAAPGAALAFTSGPAHGEVSGTFEGEPLFHASLDPLEYRALLDAAGFEVAAKIEEDIHCGGHTVWLAQAR